jgi:hypothetical protein
MAGRHRRGLDRTLSSTVLSHDPVDSARAAQFLNWPRCGLSIRPKVHWLALEYCPRCRARIPVRLFSSALPASELYRGGSVPHSEQRRVTTTLSAGST